jgi:hypothetical protein
MRTRLGCCTYYLMGLLAMATSILAQDPQPSKAISVKSESDIGGIWIPEGSASTPPNVRRGTLDPEGKRKPDSAKVIPFLPEAEVRYKVANPMNNPVNHCLPTGIPGLMFVPYPIAIIQAPGRVVLIHEFLNQVRWIYTDEQGHPKDMEHSWYGESVGKWEGDTLVVDTIGFNDKTWLDFRGMTHSDELHTVERFHRHGAVLEYSVTIEDPKTFSQPWTVHMDYEAKPDWKIAEFVCEENNKYK